MITNKPFISNLTFYSSESCNLNCTYCYIAKADKNKKVSEAKKVKEALLDGSFLNNFKIGLKRLEQPPENISAISLWGQEPTLTLNEFTSNLEELFNYFPNFNSLFFSTNFVQHYDRIINLIKTLSQLSDKYKREFTFCFQISFDGLEETTKYRRIDGNIILNNIKNFHTDLKDVYISPYLKVSSTYHNVLSREIISNYTTLEQVKNFWLGLGDIAHELSQYNTNPNFHPSKYFSPGIENPAHDATTEDGLNFFNFLQKSNICCREQDFKEEIFDFYQGVIIQFSDTIARRIMRCLEQNKWTILDLVEKLTDMFYYDDFIKLFSEQSFCCGGYTDLKMRYDGTLLHCQNVLYDFKHKDQDEYKDIMYDNCRQSVVDTFYPNIITSTDEEIDNYLYRSKLSNEQGLPIIFIQTLQLMIYLAETGQIKLEYLQNQELLYKHAFIMSNILTCMDSAMITTGTIFGRHIGDIRFYCNGVIDLIEESIEKILEKNGVTYGNS